MRSLVVYDSMFGNTEKIAKEIGRRLGGNTNILLVSKVKEKDLGNLDLLIVGSPTHGGRPTKDVVNFLNIIPIELRTAFYDTRLEKESHGFGLKIVLSVIGFAAEKMERQFMSRGGKILIKAEGFVVTDKKGPMKEGEMERLKNWVGKIRSKLKVLMVK